MKSTEDILVFSEAAASAPAAARNANMTYNPQGLISKRVKKKNSRKRMGKVLGVEKFVGKNNKMFSDKEYEQKWTNYPTEILEFAIENDTPHPTQKPVPLFEYLVQTYSNEGETVLDNVMGSGTTGIAALNAKRNFIGIEKDESFFKLALDRIPKNVILNYTLKVFQGGQHEEHTITNKKVL